MRTISLKLPERLLTELARTAMIKRVTKSSLIRKSLEKALHDETAAGEESCFDRARDLAGSVKGLPKDLAHNPKYLDGFGQ